MNHRAKNKSHVRQIWSLPVAIALAIGANSAYAQAVTGGIYGQTEKGQTVLIDSVNTGVKRVITPKVSGRFSVIALNPGPYQVDILQDGKIVSKAIVIVKAGAMSVAPNATAAPIQPKTTLATVEVEASEAEANFSINSIDTRTSQLVTHYSAPLLYDLPVTLDPESIALLQSNVNSEQQTTGSIQLNGATPGENRYFLNGFDITNNDSNIRSFGVPADAIASTSVITTGSDASWSNATGGILSTTVKQGTDKFKAGDDFYFTPATSQLLEPLGKGSVNSIGEPVIWVPSETHYGPTITNNYWASGPLIKHKLFLYALFSDTPPRNNTVYHPGEKVTYNNPDRTGLFNLTWDATNRQTVDLIGSYTKNPSYTEYDQLAQTFGPLSPETSTGWTTYGTTTKYLIGDYNWQVNENFAAHVMAGVADIVNTSNSSAQEAALASGTGGQLPPCATMIDPVTQVGTLLSPDDVCTVYNPTVSVTHGYKADFTWWHGPSKLQFGAQYYLESESEGFITVPAGDWTYQDLPGQVLPNGSVISTTDGNYVTQQLFSEVRDGHTAREAAYIQDSLQVAPRLLLYGGVRWDDDIYDVTGGQHALTLRSISPRLGFAWDVDGNSTFKIGGTLGQYALAMPMNFSAVIGQVDPLSYVYYTYTGISPDGAPQGVQQIGAPLVIDSSTPPPAYQKISRNLQGMQADAFSLYAEKDLKSSWSGMIAFTAEKLNRAVDQTCNNVPLVDVAQSSGFPSFNISSADNSLCTYFNPGNDLVVSRDFGGNGKVETLTVPASLLGYPGPTHHYFSLTLQASHKPTNNAPYFLNVSYTFQRDYGNYDGLLDLAHDNPGYPADTYQYTYPVMMIGADGNLSDDVRNTIAASGVYYFHNGWARGLTLGGTLNFATGAPLSCLGTYPDISNPAAITRGPTSHFCGGQVMKQGGLRLPSYWYLNASIGYKWRINRWNQLYVSLQIDNITNNQRPVNEDETYDTGQFLTPTTLQENPSYLAVTEYQAPRSVMLVARYRFN